MRWLDGRKRAGPTLHVCRATTRARGVGEARTFRLDLTLLARRQREDEVDPEGLDVRGRGECPDPAARYPAGGWAQLAGAPSPAPASSCTTILSLSRGQAADGSPTRRLAAPARRRTPPRCAPASQKLLDPRSRSEYPEARSWHVKVCPTLRASKKERHARVFPRVSGVLRGARQLVGETAPTSGRTRRVQGQRRAVFVFAHSRWSQTERQYRPRRDS